MINKLIAWLKHLRLPAGLPPVVRDAIPWAGVPPAIRVTADVRAVTNGRAYQIVRNLGNGELWSYLTSHVDHSKVFEPRDNELRYFPGRVTRPRYGKLFVMDSLPHAEAMVGERSHNRGLEIWAVDVRGEEAIPDGADVADTRAFWDGESRAIPCLPTGTLVCNTVTLRERVA